MMIMFGVAGWMEPFSLYLFHSFIHPSVVFDGEGGGGGDVHAMLHATYSVRDKGQRTPKMLESNIRKTTDG